MKIEKIIENVNKGFSITEAQALRLLKALNRTATVVKNNYDENGILTDSKWCIDVPRGHLLEGLNQTIYVWYDEEV